MATSSVSFLWRDLDIPKRFRTGVSLHSHTAHSRESLVFLPKVLYPIPVAGFALRKLEEQYQRTLGCRLEYERGYWTPPLSAQDAFLLERSQIERQLQLQSLVSLTDHDDLEACNLLRILDKGSPVPLSVEWTAPFQQAVFHIGAHNLPASDAAGWMREMRAFTRQPNDERLVEMLQALDRIPDVLLVLNHPMSDEGRVGRRVHRASLDEFLRRCRSFIHALELNGMQPWIDNRSTIDLAESVSLPVISGGDRHGCEPNANINLTNARSIAEFIREVRDGSGHVLFMPQYRESLAIRYLENVWHMIREYPEYAGRRHWSERVFFDHPLLGFGPLSGQFRRIPWPITRLVQFVEWFMSSRVRSTLSLLAPRKQISL
jgi:hypothetical protein